MIRFTRDPQPPHSAFKKGMIRDLGASLEALFVGQQDAVAHTPAADLFPPPRVEAPSGVVPPDPTPATATSVGTVGLSVVPTGPKYAGQVLTAKLTGAIATGFQWYRDTSAISGATNISGDGTSSVYTVQAADVVPGVELSVRPSGLTLKGSAGVAAATPPSFITGPSFSATPQVGVQVAYTGGTAAGVPAPTITTTLSVEGVQVALPYTPVAGDASKAMLLTQVAENSAGTATASASAAVLAAPPGPVPVNSVLPAITGTAQEGQTLTVSNGTWTNAPTGYTRQWLRNGATPIGSGATTYTAVAGDVGATISCSVVASNANGSSTAATSAATAAVAAAAAAPDTRPRFFLAPANAYTTNTAALVAGGTPLTGGTNGGKAGSFSLTTTAGNYGWLAVLASAVGAGIRVFDGAFYGGWSGAGLAGNNSGDSTDPSTQTQAFTDGNGNTWALIRQDYINANPTPATYTVS